MYSASLAPYLERFSATSRAVAAYFLTDQAYALSVNRFAREPGMPYRGLFYLEVAAPNWLVWVAATAAGALVGAQVPEGWSLEFAIPLIFMALIFPAVTDRAAAAAALAASVIVVAAHPLPLNLALIVAALGGVGAGLFVEAVQRARAAER